MVRPLPFVLLLLTRNPIPRVRNVRRSLLELYTTNRSMACSSSATRAETCSEPSTSTTQVRCRARVAYDGSRFAGFQYQYRPSKKYQPRTVQGELEQVLSRRLSVFGDQGDTFRVVAAGRTDAGVHARGQAIHFDVLVDTSRRPLIPKEWLDEELPKVQKSLESMLPRDLVLYNLQVAPDPLVKCIGGQMMEMDWNVMYDATLKWYSYRLHVGPVMSPLERHSRWHPDKAQEWFNEDRFRRLLECFQGRHDFRAFAGRMERLEESRRQLEEVKNGNRTTNVTLDDGDCLVDSFRTVRSIKFVPEYPDENGATYFYRIDVWLEGALYKQVRNMVGSVVDVCRGRITEKHFQNLLNASLPNNGRADNKAKPAPPQGLTLEHVYFENDHDESF